MVQPDFAPGFQMVHRGLEFMLGKRVVTVDEDGALSFYAILYNDASGVQDLPDRLRMAQQSQVIVSGRLVVLDVFQHCFQECRCHGFLFEAFHNLHLTEQHCALSHWHFQEWTPSHTPNATAVQQIAIATCCLLQVTMGGGKIIWSPIGELALIESSKKGMIGTAYPDP